MSKYAFEKCNKFHPDKVADRIAGALVDYCYNDRKNLDDPICAFEVLIGHDTTTIIGETNVSIPKEVVSDIVTRMVGYKISNLQYIEVMQDEHLANNQRNNFRCGDNGIFKGVPLQDEEKKLIHIAKHLEDKYKSDGKYIIDWNENGVLDLTICQSCATIDFLEAEVDSFRQIFDVNIHSTINPLGYWTGGIKVDSGATNRKIGSDMGRAATGGGLHGKDLSKADVTLNILCNLYANLIDKTVYCRCSIGDEIVTFVDEDNNVIDEIDYDIAVHRAKVYIESIGGFEKFAEYGLLR